jgi:hypothetical protein
MEMIEDLFKRAKSSSALGGRHPADFRAALSCEALESRLLLSGNMPGGGVMGNNPVLMAEHQAMLDLVPYASVTRTAVHSGAWSDPHTWQGGLLPNAGANVLIPMGITVTVDGTNSVPLHTIRDDGTLQFSTTHDSSLLVDTIVETENGNLIMGTAANPIPLGVHAQIEFADDGPIDTNWDPHFLSRGLIAHGNVSVYGAPVTPYVGLSGVAHKGDTTLTLAQVPVDWQAGDQLVLTGTNASQNQDEKLQILAIAGNKVTVAPLKFDHVPPQGLSVYVADESRNVIFRSQNAQDITRHGHVMFMHSDMVDLHNAGFYDLGRTDKSRPIDDPQFDAKGKLIPGTGLNPRGRYAVHFHRGGTDSSMMPATVTGCVVTDSPGWGFVNHSSYVNFTDNVAFNVVGAGFVTEAGDEIGSFAKNLAIRSTGTGHLESELDLRLANQDFGYSGHGFWFQGPGVSVIDNIAVGQRDTGFMYFTQGLVQQGLGLTGFPSMNLSDPMSANGQPTVPVGNVPVRAFSGNVAFASFTGLAVWEHLLNAAPDARSVFQNFTAWDCSHSGINVYNSAQVTLQNDRIIGSTDLGERYGIDGGGVERDVLFDNVSVENCQIGIRTPTRGHNVIEGGYLDNIQNIVVNGGQAPDLAVTIGTDVKFGTLSAKALNNAPQANVTVQPGRLPWRLDTFFETQGVVRSGGQQYYAAEQAPNYVPFPAGHAPSFVPPELIGKTNRQLWAQYGLAIGGFLAPTGAQTGPHVQGLVGRYTSPPPTLTLLSPRATNQLTGYQLVYQDASGKRVVDPQHITLHNGWNVITRSIGGMNRSFLVFADAIPPTFTVDPHQTLAINPVDLRKPFFLNGTVKDATGTWNLHLVFSNLSTLPLKTRPDGSKYVVLQAYFWDRMGVARKDLTLELTVDPKAPIY